MTSGLEITLLAKCPLERGKINLNLLASKEKNAISKENILRLENAQYARAENQGVKGFHIYNGWAGVLGDLKKFDEAIEKYDLAMKYFGDKTWVLMNKGSILFAKGAFKGAEENLYKSSLEFDGGCL